MTKTSNVSPERAASILRNVSHHAFRFATDIGAYTGGAATSLAKFHDHLAGVPLQSIAFHLYPRQPDFQRWVRETLGDEQLAEQLAQIKRSSGEKLRKTLKTVIGYRLEHLKITALTRVKGIGPTSATKLVAGGVDSIDVLAAHAPDGLAQQVGVSENVAARWIRDARDCLAPSS
jgi:predicted flap endonuclease-1-like 5' DNA nuclease